MHHSFTVTHASNITQNLVMSKFLCNFQTDKKDVFIVKKKSTYIDIIKICVYNLVLTLHDKRGKKSKYHPITHVIVSTLYLYQAYDGDNKYEILLKLWRKDSVIILNRV